MKVYFAMAREQEGKFYAWVQPFNDGDNVHPCISLEDVIVARLVKNKEEAFTIVQEWNKAFAAKNEQIYQELY